MKLWIRRLVGFEELEMSNKALFDEVIGLRNDIALLFTDEFDEKRKELSDKIGERAKKRLQDETNARALTGGQDY